MNKGGEKAGCPRERNRKKRERGEEAYI